MQGDARDDGELLDAYVAGDAAAFAALYDRHDRASFAFVRRMLAHDDPATAEDVHQEAWLAVARGAASFDATRSRFVTWLFTVARNKVMDHFRDRKVAHLSALQPLDDAACVPDEASPGPFEAALSRERAAAIAQAVEALPLVQRETFVLFAHAGLSLDEVAAATGVGNETAKSRLRYARDTLRRRLAGWTTNDA